MTVDSRMLDSERRDEVIDPRQKQIFTDQREHIPYSNDHGRHEQTGIGHDETGHTGR